MITTKLRIYPFNFNTNSSTLDLNCFIFFDAIDTSHLLGIILLLILLFCSALISGAEVALFSITQSDFETGEEYFEEAFDDAVGKQVELEEENE